MSFRSMDSRPPPSPNLHHHDHQPTSGHHHHHRHHRQQPSLHDPSSYRYTSSPYPSSPQLPQPLSFSSESYLRRAIPPPPPPLLSQSPNPNPNPNYYQLSFREAPTHHPHCSVASNFQYFPPAAPNREGIVPSSDFSSIEFDQDLRSYSFRVDRGPTFVSPVRLEEELLRTGTACYGGYDSSSRGSLYGNEINRRPHELDSVGDLLEFRIGSLDYGVQEFGGGFSSERRDDSYSRRSIGGLDKEYDVTPIKQVQKRSAFSRLQMPKIYHSPRKFDRERCYGSVYDDKNGLSQSRCKGVLPCPEITVKDRRNGKSVDLDVSFKSNSLVAKAVVAASSSALALDDDPPPNAQRLRSLGQFDKESDCSLLRNKFEEDLHGPNRIQSMVTAPTGSKLVPNRGSPSKFNRPKNEVAYIKDSGKLSLKKEIEQGMEKLSGFSIAAGSSELVKEEKQIVEGIVSAGSGGMGSCSNKNSVKIEPGNDTDEARKSVKISNTDKAVRHIKNGTLSLGKGDVAAPKESVVVVRDKVSVHKSDKKDDHLNNDDDLAIHNEAGNEKGVGGKFKMVLKANKARHPLKKDNVLVKKSQAGKGKDEGGTVEILPSAYKSDLSLRSSIKAVPGRKGRPVGPTRNVPVSVDAIVFLESGERKGRSSETDFSVADGQVIGGLGEVGAPTNVSKAEKSTYTGDDKSNLVLGQGVSAPESGEKPGCSNECDISASNNAPGKCRFESGGTEKFIKVDIASADQLSCKDSKLVLRDEGGGEGAVSSSDKGKIIGGDENSIPSQASARKVVQKKMQKKIVKRVVKKVVKKVRCHPEIHNSNLLPKNDKSCKPGHVVMVGPSTIGHASTASECPPKVEAICSDIRSTANAGNIVSRTLEKEMLQTIKGDVNGEDDNRMNSSPKQRKNSVSISQVGPYCIKETINSAYKAFENSQNGLSSNSSQSPPLDFTSEGSIQSCTPIPTNGELGKEPVISKDESMYISRSDRYHEHLLFDRIRPGPDKGLISAQEPVLLCGSSKESIAYYPSMPSTSSVPPEDRHDVLEGSSDTKCMESSSNLKENSNVPDPDKYNIFEHDLQSSLKNHPMELYFGGTTGSSNVLIPDKKFEKCSFVNQGAGNNMSSDKRSFSAHDVQPGRDMLNPCYSHANVVDNSQDLTSEESLTPMLKADHVPATDEGVRLSGIEGGPLDRVTLNVTEIPSEKRCSTTLLDDAILPGIDISVNNSSQTQAILNDVLLPGSSSVQNELSDPHKMGDYKEGLLASTVKSDHKMDILKKNGESEIMDTQASEKQGIGRCEMSQSDCPGEIHFHKVDKIMPLSPLGNHPQDSPFSIRNPCAQFLNSESSNELMGPQNRPLSDRSSSEEIDICLGSKTSICKAPLEQSPPRMTDNDSIQQAEEPSVPGETMNLDGQPVVRDGLFNSNSVQDIQKDYLIQEKSLHLPREDFRSSDLCHMVAGLPGGPKLSILEQRTFPVCSSFSARTSTSNNSTMNSRTWHRTGNLTTSVPGMQPSANVLPMRRNFAGINGKLLDASYVRKGNSLVRKPTPPASHCVSSTVQKSSSSVMAEAEQQNGYGKPVNSFDHMKFLTTEGTVSSSERPLSTSGTFPNHTFLSSEKLSTSISESPLGNISDVQTANPGQGSHFGFSCEDTEDARVHKKQVSSASMNDVKNGSLNNILYVKPKSNQLVAAKGLSDQDIVAEKNKALTSSGYFKRKRNQLVRSSIGNSFARVTATHPVDAASEDRGTPGGLLPSWKCYPMVPLLFPWKRSSYWRKRLKTSLVPSGRSFPASSQRLKLLRKRDAIYIRSKHGLSVRRSKVLSVGGASLKWSKSIESRSKKVNEEATRAVLEAQKGRKEQKASSSPKTEKENNGPRGRIFRIGSQHYMMDPSRRTLQRLPDDESSKSAASGTKKLLTKLYVPRRLLIGNDEYVRIGNGNQLIRNPKRRSRLLASEKVRWSLHTARQRLAKKKKYCQFFTRFGKCNKDSGKCPYIHDPSKIAVCTKFLNGLCSNKDCKLTHKIIPERMPDCSFFLQGLCANKNCPYRHVNVNPKSPTCEAFLRGYCMDGNECRKKHSYVCPVFGATGNCPQGSKCKLHHPKARNKGKKRKRSREKKNGQDRYFGNTSRRVLESRASVAEKPLPDAYGETLDLPDYISLGSSDDEAGHGAGIGDGESDPSDLPLSDLDGLIIPFGLRQVDMTSS